MRQYHWLKSKRSQPLVIAPLMPNSVTPRASRRALVRIIAVAGLTSLLFWGGLAATIYSLIYNVGYPGAAYIAGQTLYKHTSSLTVRRDVSYRSNDEFNKLYHWYSVGFQLGTERYGQSKCILLARSSQLLWRIEQNMSVMLCDASADRMIFVMRSFTLRYPDWLRNLLRLYISIAASRPIQSRAIVRAGCGSVGDARW